MTDDCTLCDFCLYEKELELPQLPEMTFPTNSIRLEHENGFGIEFNALEALKLVDSKNDVMKVAISEAWQESRLDDSKIKDVVKPFDWTYSSHYKGTLFGKTDLLNILPTEERIDVEKLKVKSKILFYQDLILFEDELADNGTAQLSVKMRIMPDSFFILLRYFLRVDHLLVRIIDTRLYYEEGTNYLLREHMTKENKIKDLTVSPALLNNPSELWDHLTTVSFEYEKIEFQN
ncbi:TIP41-like protein [Caerostris darwini]|uniref:TIP41-like protein n=1 Tax=Caerostris darwini TaxID=1538125 RepID=A0AAV4V589_9ARAC|nr:TIP41-like protein [Caerostris darwini]